MWTVKLPFGLTASADTDIWTELAGSLGDLGTLVPILVSLAAAGQTNLTASLVIGGVYNIIAGCMFKIPICVQPMKAIAAIALTTKMTSNQIGAAGFTTSAVVFILCATRLLTPIYRLCPLPLIRGIQLGTGLSLVNKGVTAVLSSTGKFPVTSLSFWTDNWLVALVCFSGVVVMYPVKRLNFTAVVLTAYCLVVALVQVGVNGANGGWKPVGPGFSERFFMWQNLTANDFRVGFLNAGLGQIPLTLLNSVLATSKLADDLFPDKPRPVASISAVGLFVGLMNLIGVWFGSMPWCLGSGGLAGQYRFGARTHLSVLFLGVFKIVLGLVFGNALLPIIQAFPASVMGVMLVIAGVELASCMRDLTVTDPKKLNSSSHGFMVAFVGGSVVVASGNDGIGFLVASITAFILWVHEVDEDLREVNGNHERVPSDAEAPVVVERKTLFRAVSERLVAHVRYCFRKDDV
ncbi:hypothetical protein HDU78_008152 [Chytriomyces hyalinus]|nr:hypothetical protein HDU78_008152 [Chytriomyces hyalinus]